MVITRTIRNIRSRIVAYPELTILSAIMAFALLLRAPCLNYCISPDEAFSYEEFIRRGFKGIFLDHYGSGNHPLASFSAWIFTLVLGRADWVLQLPFLIIGMATIPLIYIAATRAFGNKLAGLSAAFMLAWSPCHTAYSVNMRGYVPLMFFALAATTLLQANLAKATWLKTIGLAISVFLMAMSHLASLLILSAWAAVMFVYALAGLFLKTRRNRKHWFNFIATTIAFAAAGGLIELGYRPVFSCFNAVFERALTHQWPKDFNNYLCGAEQTFWHPIERFEETISGFSGVPFYVVSAIALIGVMVPLVRRKWSAGIFLFAIILPITTILAVKLKLTPRYTLPVLPFFTASFGAGVFFLAQGTAKIASRISSSNKRFTQFTGVAAYCAPLIFLGSAILNIYGDDFPFAPTKIACVFQNHKAASQYIAKYASSFDAIIYEHGDSTLPDYYLQYFYYPNLKPADQPPPIARLWHISTLNSPERYRPECPAGSNPVLAASFRGASVWVSDIAPYTMRQVSLPPFMINANAPENERLAPWKWKDSQQDKLDVFLSQDIRFPDKPVIEISPKIDDVKWKLESPTYPCAAGEQALFQAEIRGRTDTRSVGISICFFDEAGNEIQNWNNWTPSATKSTPAGEWKTCQISTMAPLNAKTATCSLIGRTPQYNGETFAFRNVKLWVNNPKTTP